MIGEIRQNFTKASASVGLILATALNRWPSERVMTNDGLTDWLTDWLGMNEEMEGRVGDWTIEWMDELTDS